MSYYSDEFIDMAFGNTELEKLLSSFQGGETVSAARLLALTDGLSDDAMEELFQHLIDLDVAIDLSDLPKPGASGESALRLREEEQLAQKEDLLRNLEPNDPLRLYLEELAGIPVCGDIGPLVLELQELNREEAFDERVFNSLLNLSLSRVVEITREYVGHGVLMLDLIQEGSLGLWTELECYDFGNFEQFRDRAIRRAMACAVIRQARASGLGQKMRQAVEDYRMTDERLLSELGRNPTAEEMAEALHMSVEEAESIRKTLDNARMMGKAHTETEEKEESPEDEQAVEDTAYYQTREKVDDLMSGLTELESRLLNMRFGLDGKAPMTAHQVAEKLRMTIQDVVDMEAKALEKMRRSGE